MIRLQAVIRIAACLWCLKYGIGGRLEEMVSIRGDVPFGRTEYTYDNSGELRQALRYRLGERQGISEKRVYARGKEVEITHYKVDGSIEIKQALKYDEAGNELEATLYDGDGRLISITRSTYAYDNYGNWTKREQETVSGGNSSRSATTRTISYFDEASPPPRSHNVKSQAGRRLVEV